MQPSLLRCTHTLSRPPPPAASVSHAPPHSAAAVRAVSFTALWFLGQTTATIYSLVGALNKIPVAIVGIMVFHEASSPQNMASIGIGLFAGILFVVAKSRGK